jgi:hypothetical protein
LKKSWGEEALGLIGEMANVKSEKYHSSHLTSAVSHFTVYFSLKFFRLTSDISRFTIATC